MRAKLLLLGCVAALALDPGHARADGLVPTYIHVTGRGEIRFRMTAGATIPCDSGDNAPLYDGWVEPGAYVFMAPPGRVCLEHTYGAFRQLQWSRSRLMWTSEFVNWVGNRWEPLQLEVSTDHE